MSRWYVINLGDAMVAATDLAELRERFHHFHREQGNPTEMALYYRHVADGHLHCQVLVYFPPEAIEFARQSGAQPCAPPAPDDVELLAGGPS